MSQTSPPQDDAPAVAALSYEQARDELVTLVARIESGQVPLEDAMLLWERGEALAAHCQAKLDAAQETLDRAIQGTTAATPSADGRREVDDEADGVGGDEATEDATS
jgi:exodeoxyribonuclease VII small subunit